MEPYLAAAAGLLLAFTVLFILNGWEKHRTKQNEDHERREEDRE